MLAQSLTWYDAAIQALKDFYLFAKIDPGSALIVLAVGMIVGRKVFRHFNKGSNYNLRDIRKYPGEILELAANALILVAGLLIKAVC